MSTMIPTQLLREAPASGELPHGSENAHFQRPGSATTERSFDTVMENAAARKEAKPQGEEGRGSGKSRPVSQPAEICSVRNKLLSCKIAAPGVKGSLSKQGKDPLVSAEPRPSESDVDSLPAVKPSMEAPPTGALADLLSLAAPVTPPPLMPAPAPLGKLLANDPEHTKSAGGTTLEIPAPPPTPLAGACAAPPASQTSSSPAPAAGSIPNRTPDMRISAPAVPQAEEPVGQAGEALDTVRQNGDPPPLPAMSQQGESEGWTRANNYSSLSPPAVSKEEGSEVRASSIRSSLPLPATPKSEESAVAAAIPQQDSGPSTEAQVPRAFPPQANLAQPEINADPVELPNRNDAPIPQITLPADLQVANASGTGGAKASPRMKKAEQNDLPARDDGHFMPSAAMVGEESPPDAGSAWKVQLNSAPAESDPPSLGATARPDLGPRRSEAEAGRPHAPSAFSAELHGTTSTPFLSTAPASADSIRVRPAGPLEPIQALISNWAVDIRRTKTDAMEVVLKPNAQTELSLRLSLQHGLVEVAAEFKRGDMTSLNAHWEQLQQSLSSQGIRLGALQPASAVDFSGHTSTGEFNQSSRPPTDQPELGEELPARGRLPASLLNQQKTTTSPGSPTKRRWESWA